MPLCMVNFWSKSKHTYLHIWIYTDMCMCVWKNLMLSCSLGVALHNFIFIIFFSINFLLVFPLLLMFFYFYFARPTRSQRHRRGSIVCSSYFLLPCTWVCGWVCAMRVFVQVCKHVYGSRMPAQLIIWFTTFVIFTSKEAFNSFLFIISFTAAGH